MKNLYLLALVLMLIVSCFGKGVRQDSRSHKTHPAWVDGATIYELNTRQLTAEGTFAAATAELPRLAELGVDIVWVMPIQPIGVLERKGSLGSYYAIADYRGFNAEFGTRADFQNFVDTAHGLGMRVVLDWVANHTAPDHLWAANEGWHKRDSLGKMKVQYDWTDITELDYDNADMRRAMVDDMKFWVDSIGVDGFRCDMAMLVPTDFWQTALVELQKSNPDILMLSEAEEPELVEQAFDMYYGWELHHIMNAIAQGEITADSLSRYLVKAKERFPEGAIRMNFTSNHDENSWAGTENERMGAAVEAMAALTYVLPGMPLIYSGQELGNTKRLRFFDKDTVQRVPSARQTLFYRDMNAIRESRAALKSSEMTILKSNLPDKVFAVERSAGDKDRMVAVFNLSPDVQIVELEYKNSPMRVVSTGIKSSPAEPMVLQGWEYRLFL